ncbi:putative porin, partial [Bacteroides acidifaciens]|uniref:putative porin n=3 Tax=Bacteroides TaxID=816 RepID=UPI0030142098
NTVGIALLEGFNKYAKAGLTAFASYKISKYTLMNMNGSLSHDKYNENEIFVGGELSKGEGNVLHYHAIGEVGLAGKAIGQFNVKGDIDLNFPLWKDTVSLIARGEISNKLAPFYMRHYHSKHFLWDNDMDKEFRTRIEGELSIARWRTRLKAGVENIKNYTYFNQQATPEQKSGSLQVLSASLNQDFKLGIFHLDNEMIWQKSSDQTVLPLPDLSLYHNFYMQFKLAKKVLSVQLGADVRYFTKYNAPAYTPAIQNFHLQSANDQVKIGGYPIVNVYANLHLKRTRFYVMMYHVNQGVSRPNYFLSPHYPINPRFLKFGLSWNFYD